MAENKPSKAPKSILHVGFTLALLMLAFAIWSGWNMYDIWGKIESIEIAALVIAIISLTELTVDEPSELHTFYPTHPITKAFLIFTIPSMPVWFIAAILSRFNVYVPVANVMQYVSLFLFDALCIFGIIKTIQVKIVQKQLTSTH